jgi:glycosyltransferase involved in cell wall biosynthesis
MEENLKVLMTADTLGGVFTYAVELCKALQEYNVEVHLLTMGALLNQEQEEQLQQLTNVKLYESNYKLEWMQDCWQDVEKAKDWVTSIYRKVEPYILHFNNFGQTDGDWNCPIITVYHSCVATWWRAVKGEDLPEDWEKYDETVRKALAASDAIVAPSIAMLEQAEEAFGSFTTAEVIYNGRDIETATREKEPYILSAGRIWDEAKNIALLSSIAHKLNWPVYIAGNNTDPGTGETPTLENIEFVGALSSSEIKECMERAAVFCMPAKYEPFGLAILEAAKAGCALALSNIDSLREIWGDAALYFDPHDQEEASTTINRLINDPDLRREMAAKATIRAKDFNARAMAQKYIKLYRKLSGATLETMNKTTRTI